MNVSPSCARARWVSCTTSALIEVESTGPCHSRIAGTISPVLFPDCAGPTPSTDTRCSATISVPWCSPRVIRPAAGRRACSSSSAAFSRATATSYLGAPRSRAVLRSTRAHGCSTPWPRQPPRFRWAIPRTGRTWSGPSSAAPSATAPSTRQVETTSSSCSANAPGSTRRSRGGHANAGSANRAGRRAKTPSASLSPRATGCPPSSTLASAVVTVTIANGTASTTATASAAMLPPPRSRPLMAEPR